MPGAGPGWRRGSSLRSSASHEVGREGGAPAADSTPESAPYSYYYWGAIRSFREELVGDIQHSENRYLSLQKTAS
jgi:hypothetical protein